MIKKEILLNDGTKFLVGFKEIESWSRGSTKGIECHVLKKSMFLNKTIHKRFYIKGIVPDYLQMAITTILDYKRVQEQKRELISSNWI